MIALIQTPHRFRTKRQLWTYSGLGIETHDSAEYGYVSVKRLSEVPGLGVDSAQQIIAEVGAMAATFPRDKNLVSWVGACPGDEESAGVSRSHRSPKGNRNMRRLLNQCASAAVKLTVFSSSSTGAYCRAWDTIKQSGPSPISSAA